MINLIKLFPSKTADEVQGKNEPIEKGLPLDQVRKEAYPLNQVLEWCIVDIFDQNEVCYLIESPYSYVDTTKIILDG